MAKSNYAKVVILNMIKERKELLFGSLTHPLTNEDRHGAWREVHEKAISLGVVMASKSWEYVRDTTWANWKLRTLVKKDNKKRTGTGGGISKQYTEMDNIILDIIGRESPLIEGLNVPESMQENGPDFELLSPTRSPRSPVMTEHPQSSPLSNRNRAPSRTKARPAPKVMWKVGSSTSKPQSVEPGATTNGVCAETPNERLSTNKKLKRRISMDEGCDLHAKKLRLQLDLMLIDKRTKVLQLYKLEKKIGLPASEFTKEIHDAIPDAEDTT